MKIQLTENIRIKQSSRNPESWDVLRVYVGRRKDKMVEVEKPMAYGRSFEDCIKSAPLYDKRVSDKRLLELNEFLVEYKNITEKIKENIKNYVEQLNN